MAILSWTVKDVEGKKQYTTVTNDSEFGFLLLEMDNGMFELSMYIDAHHETIKFAKLSQTFTGGQMRARKLVDLMHAIDMRELKRRLENG